MANHTTTHLLNHAIRTLVNAKAEQRGSIVTDERFRFDFDAPAALTRDEIQSLDAHVNAAITAKLPVTTRLVPLAEARQIAGVRAMFGEAYPDPVRVVAVGADLDAVLANRTNPDWLRFSIEFCGGTHLSNTAEAERFAIVSEEPVAAGIRRIVAVTGDAARQAHADADRLERALSTVAAAPDDQFSAALTRWTADFDSATLPAWRRHDLRAQLAPLLDRVRRLVKEDVAKKRLEAGQFVQQTLATLRDTSIATPTTWRIVVERLEVGTNNRCVTRSLPRLMEGRVLSDLIGELLAAAKKELQLDLAVLLFSADAAKAICVANVAPALIGKGLKANEWVAEVARVMGGKGGGSPKGDVAQGYGSPSLLDAALARARAYAAEKLQ